MVMTKSEVAGIVAVVYVIAGLVYTVLWFFRITSPDTGSLFEVILYWFFLPVIALTLSGTILFVPFCAWYERRSRRR